jgi:TusA-related sulfurtransferase
VSRISRYKTKENNLNPYESLANGIILQAVKDYKQSLKDIKKIVKEYDTTLKKEHSREELKRIKKDFRFDFNRKMKEKEEVEVFFFSEWYKQLTSVDSKYLVNKLKKEVDYDEKLLSR